MSNTIYLAAAFRKRFLLQGCRADVLRAGFTVVSRWIDLKEENVAEALQCAHDDLDDIKLADILIAFPDPPRTTNSRGGFHFETGFAAALGRRVIVVGSKSNIFHELFEFFPTWPQACSALAREQRLAA
jgi:nucleoside 2-deoxyribosyltransferase